MKYHNVVFLPSEKRGLIEEGTLLRDAAREVGEGIEAVCGGRGKCGKCKVRIMESEAHGVLSGIEHLSPLTEEERAYADGYGLRKDERLACQARVVGDLAVFVPEESRVYRFSVHKPSGERTVDIIPSIQKYCLEPHLFEYSEDASHQEILTKELQKRFGLKNLGIDPYLESRISPSVKQHSSGLTVTVWENREVIRIEAGYHQRKYGLALDIGTTTVAGYLCDLDSGEIVSGDAVLNPQIRFGEDVMSRIAYAKDNEGGLAEMNEQVVSAINDLINEIAGVARITPEDICEAVVVGNTVMHHIFLGLDVMPLGKWPFSPVLSHSVNRKAGELGIGILPSANIHVLPIEAAFVGADNVGVMLAEEPYNQDEMILIADLGTNGELLLGNRQHLISASCATGPAFEGGNIRFGMRAASGAIDRIRIDPHSLELSYGVIGRREWSTELPQDEIMARGVCGSGIVDAVAEMLTAGIINYDGSFNKSSASTRLRLTEEGKPEFVIADAPETLTGREIVVNQRDIRAVQLAKAAIYTGSRLMLRRMGVEVPDRILLAGAFGAVIDPRRAMVLGMFPDCAVERIQPIGNAAGDGARIALLNREKRDEADRVARQVEYIELTSEPGFEELFILATHFPRK
ncbi:MAG: ASKHA domain-containing protein [Dehalococcoidia bacterium]